jgi:copper chaperone
MAETLRLTVTGMSCGGCENAIKQSLQQVAGVGGVTASYKANLVGVSFDADKVTPDMITERIQTLGYTVVEIGRPPAS